MAEPLNHLNASAYVVERPFKSVLRVIRPPAPARERYTHGQRLLRQLEDLRRVEADFVRRRNDLQLPAAGLTIAVELRPSGMLDYKKFDWKRDGIELLNATPGEEFDLVVVHIPDGKLTAFEKRITDYLEKNTKAGNPKSAALVNVIEGFRRAAFDELWTDLKEPPDADAPQWFQLWLRVGTGRPEAVRDTFAQVAARLGIEVENGYVPFPGRVVLAAYTTRAVLEQAVNLLDVMAEIRSVQPTADFFLSELTPADQVQWVRNLEARLETNDREDAAYVTLLDTGVAHGHPLIQASLHPADLHAIDAAWTGADTEGHGTEMAGILLHGNLSHPLASAETYEVPHRMESVKIHPPHGQNPYRLYGWVMRQATSIVEALAADRRRTFAMMTTCTEASTGLPSEWSASIDQLAADASGTLEPDGERQRRRRLFVLAGGNVQWPQWSGYPNINAVSGIESPAQAWNALTVGAHTNLTEIDAATWPGLSGIAPAGAMSPCSTTSLVWWRSWPFKPDVVAEGGNGSLDQGQPLVGPESLRLLTTNFDMTKALLTETGDTSAAAAEVARLCAHLSTRYPDYWPETIRALVVHGARYTPAMRALLPLNPVRLDKEGILRRFGHGAVNADGALNSRAWRPTLVLQETLHPYKSEAGSIKLNALNLHTLPWPIQQLLALGEAAVEMRITLSYFIDPNPSQRGWQSKFRYQSHGLRFAVKGATETPEIFGQRINKIEREDAEAAGDGGVDAMNDPDTQGWLFGTQLRARGSLHSDVWRGTAAQLAEKSHLAVFPVGGWWKDWEDAGQANTAIRYALIVSLEIDEALEIDLYTPIQTMIQTPIVTEIPSTP